MTAENCETTLKWKWRQTQILVHGIRTAYPVDSPLGSIVLEVGLFGVAVWEGFFRFNQCMHTVDAVDLREGVGEGIDEGHAAFLGEIITGGVIDLDHDLAVPGAEVFWSQHRL